MSWTKHFRDMTCLRVRKITVASLWKNPEGGMSEARTPVKYRKLLAYSSNPGEQ